MGFEACDCPQFTHGQMTDSTSPMKKTNEPSAELSRLLLRLDSDVVEAWRQYDQIRRKLVKFFECNRCSSAEENADEVLDRIAKKPDITQIRDIPSFAVGIARKVCFEDYRRTQRESHFEDSPGGADSVADPRDYPAEIVEQIDEEVRFGCLKECLATLRARDRKLALDYYSAEGLKDHQHRQLIAEKAGLTMDALRVRMNRIRERLEQCVHKCLEARRNQFSSTGKEGLGL